MISGFRHEVDENCALLEYYAVSSGNSLLTFQDNLSVPSYPKKKNKRWDRLVVLKRNYNYSLHNNPEERSSQTEYVTKMNCIYTELKLPSVGYEFYRNIFWYTTWQTFVICICNKHQCYMEAHVMKLSNILLHMQTHSTEKHSKWSSQKKSSNILCKHEYWQ